MRWGQMRNPSGFSERTIAVVVVVMLLFFASVAMDQSLAWRGLSGAQTFSNDLTIAGLGGIAFWFFLTLQAERQEMSRARERLILTAELNHHVRNALTMIANCVMLQDEAARLRVLDEAVQRIDHVLMELIPTANAQEKPRYFLKKAG